MFMGIRRMGRDESLIEYALKVLLQVLINFSMVCNRERLHRSLDQQQFFLSFSFLPLTCPFPYNCVFFFMVY